MLKVLSPCRRYNLVKYANGTKPQAILTFKPISVHTVFALLIFQMNILYSLLYRTCEYLKLEL